MLVVELVGVKVRVKPHRQCFKHMADVNKNLGAPTYGVSVIMIMHQLCIEKLIKVEYE